MKLTIELTGDAADSLRERARTKLPVERRDLVERLLRRSLSQIVIENPVDTGRSRAAWARVLEQLGGFVPGWQGRDAIAMREGSRSGKLAIVESAQSTTASATNSVKYIPFLEYGTHRSAPVAMVRRALAATARSLHSADESEAF